MKKRYVAISLTLGSLALAGGAQADTWEVTQKVTVGSATEMVQGNGNTNAKQAMNAISVGTLNKTSQAVDMGANTLTLSQKGATTTASVQAANYINAVTEIDGSFTQDVNSTAAAAAITLTQEAGGAANTQAVNYATSGDVKSLIQRVTPEGTEGDISLTQKPTVEDDSLQAVNAVQNATTITSLTQTVDNDTKGAGDIKLYQESGSNKLDQAVNYASAATITALAQQVSTVDLGFTQTGGNANTQVGNHAIVATSANNALTQNVAASGNIALMQQTGGEGNLQAVNAVDAAAVTTPGTVTQSATTGNQKIDLTQTGQTSSQQFVNYLTSPGTVASVTQNYSNSGKAANLLQNTTDNSNQALNAIEMTGATSVLETGTQTVNLSSLDMGQGESEANTSSFQAGNLLISAGTIASATQEVTADITLDQAKGTGNVEAVNLASGKTITSLSQTVTGLSDELNQGATDSEANTQAGNYLDIAQGGAVTSVAQTYNATSVIMDQDNITSGVQGLNVIDASASGVSVTSADQNGDVPTLTMRQGQYVATQTSVQAGNAVITNADATGGTVDQDVSVTTTLAMTQTNATKSIQAANYVGYMPNN